MSSTSAGRQSLSAGRLIDTTGFDRLFESDRSYAATVAFFDESLNQRGYHVFARTVTSTATAWAVRKPGETIANVIVRDTKPVTFEIEESMNEAAGIRVH